MARLRRVAALGAVAVVAAVLAPSVPGDAASPLPHGSVTMRVDDVLPDAPSTSPGLHRLDIALTLHNGTDRTLHGVRVTGERGYPIASQQRLDHAFAHPGPAASEPVIPFNNPGPSTRTPMTLLPNSDVDVVVRTTTGIPNTSGICECADAIYPLYFTATYTDGGTTSTVATAQTFIPSFKEKVPKLKVAWVWPLLDRPHRLGVDPSVFTDDDLAQEVAPGGRLDTMLTVVEQTAAHGVPMTLVVDPDLIDELAVMSAGPYPLLGSGKAAKVTRVSTGTSAAQDWLQRLRNVLTVPGMEIDFTALADPNVDNLTRNGLSWTAGLGAEAQSRVTQALGGQQVSNDISWPVGDRLSQPTLDTLITQGTNTVLLDDSSLGGSGESSQPLDALAPLQSSLGSAVAAVTDPRIQSLTADVLARGARGFGTLPKLVADVALRAVPPQSQTPHHSYFVVITPPRDLGIDPHHPLDAAVAVRTILATARTSWASALPLRAAAGSIRPVDHGALRDRRPARSISAVVLDDLHYVIDSRPGLLSLFTRPADATTAHLGTIPTTVQRLESSSLLDFPAETIAAANSLRRTVRTLRQKSVYLVPPRNGRNYTYTLTSDRSSLTVTVVNNLAVPVQVRLDVSRTSGPPGLNANDIGVQVIKPGLKKQIKVPTEVSVLGRYQVGVSLSTPDGLSLGEPLTLSVRSTALGTVGVIITVVAGVVLAVALLVRLTVRLRRRRRKAALRLASSAP